MDKKSIIKEQQSEVFFPLVTLCCLKSTKDCSSKHPEVRSGRHEKAGCYCCCIRDDERVTRQTEDCTRARQRLAIKMASIAMLIREALAKALAFTGSSYLFLRLSKDSIDKERKRHDEAIEHLQKARTEWVHKRRDRIDLINKQLRLETAVEAKFTEFNDAVREYHYVFGHKLPLLPREPVMSDYTKQ